MSETVDSFHETDLVSVSDIARMASVSRAAVSNWRRRHDDFPSPTSDTKAGPVFTRASVLAWLSTHDRLSATPSLESRLWAAADKLRGSLEASEYKHVVLGLVFLKYVSDAFEATRAELAGTLRVSQHDKKLEDRQRYLSAGSFWVPADARWRRLADGTHGDAIGEVIDEAMGLIEKANPTLAGVLSRGYSREDLSPRLLGELIDLVDSIGFTDVDHGADDMLGRVYEYFLGRFAASEGRNAGEFYTPRSVVRLLVEMLQPFRGTVFDPCCGSGGMFVQSAEFVDAHGGSETDLQVVGQEYVGATWRLARMNLAVRGIHANLGRGPADSLLEDQFPDLRADYIIANPPFNMDDWGREHACEDSRWPFGLPPSGNANFAWVQHFYRHLADSGLAGFVLANGSLAARSGPEWEIRKAMIESDAVDCIVALPDKLFYNTPIPVCLWFVSPNRRAAGTRAPKEQVLFIDARSLGHMESRTVRALDSDDIERIARTYHSWRAGETGEYADRPGFCKAAGIDEIRRHSYVLAPGRYVGTERNDEDANTPEQMAVLAAELSSSLRNVVATAQALLPEIESLER